jgi:DNA-binding PucR family transcriptional regulator
VTADSFELTGVQDIESLGLRTAVAADWDVGDALCRRYIEPLEDIGPALDLPNTLRTYIACGMHVERAAERLVVHPNTLRYRISRFEALTSSSLREPGTAFEVWWALERAEVRLDRPPLDEPA